MAKHSTRGSVKGAGSRMNDGALKINQRKVTSKVTVSGKQTTRTYSDGAEQVQVWPSEQHAKDYAASVREQGA